MLEEAAKIVVATPVFMHGIQAVILSSSL